MSEEEKPEVYAKLDRVTQLWREVEDKVKGIKVKEKECPLAMERSSGVMRLTFMGKPILDCPASEKVEATEFLAQFHVIWRQAKRKMIAECEGAVALLERELEKLEEEQ